MKTIHDDTFHPGTHVRRVIDYLIANAPARFLMGKIWIEVEDPNADPEVVYEDYCRNCDELRPHLPTD